MPKGRVTAILIVVATIAVLIVVITAPEPRMRNVFHALSIGFVVSAIFYFIVVWLPAWQRKARILGNLQLHYNAFKLSCISTFLVYSDSQDYEPQEMLLDQEEFRRYFSIYTSTDQTRWHNVANALDRGAYPLRDILNELEILREELLYVLNNIDVHDEKVFGFLKRLSHAIFRIKHLEPGYDDVKSLCHFLWEIFTGYSFSEGYRKEDIVQSMIEKV